MKHEYDTAICFRVHNYLLLFIVQAFNTRNSVFLVYGIYSGLLTYELNSFARAGRNSSWSYVKTIFPIRNNGNTHNAFRTSQNTPYVTFS
jgi:hypothetical protein